MHGYITLTLTLTYYKVNSATTATTVTFAQGTNLGSCFTQGAIYVQQVNSQYNYCSIAESNNLFTTSGVVASGLNVGGQLTLSQPISYGSSGYQDFTFYGNIGNINLNQSGSTQTIAFNPTFNRSDGLYMFYVTYSRSDAMANFCFYGYCSFTQTQGQFANFVYNPISASVSGGTGTNYPLFYINCHHSSSGANSWNLYYRKIV